MKVVAFLAALSASVSSVSAFSAIKAGAKIPAEEMFFDFGDPTAKVNMAAYTANKKCAVVPGYLESQDALKEAGIEEVIVYCVNDPAVMKAWAEDQGIKDSMITFLSDPYSEFTRACDMELTNEGPRSLGLIGRTKRFAMIVEKSIIKDFAVAESELDPAGDDFPEKTLAPALIKMAE